MKYAIQKGSGDIIYVPSSIKISSVIQMLIEGKSKTTWWFHKPTLCFKHKGSRLKSRGMQGTSIIQKC
jgi:hypothetical protein